jgi:hypothetical protein
MAGVGDLAGELRPFRGRTYRAYPLPEEDEEKDKKD